MSDNPTRNISGASGTYPDDNRGIAGIGGGSSYDIVGNGIFYRWTAPVTGPITVRTDAYGDSEIYDTVLYVLPNNTTTTPQTDAIAFNDDNHGYYSLVTFDAVEGTTYYFLVKGYSNPDSAGTYLLSWGNPPPPPPPPPRDDATVTFEYDGDSTLTAHIINATIGRSYRFDSWAGGSNYVTATEINFDITIIGINSSPGESFFVAVYNRNSGEPIGATCFDYGVASVGGRDWPPSITNITWDAESTIIIYYNTDTFPGGSSDLWVGENWGNPNIDYSTLGQIVITNVLSSASSGDAFDIEGYIDGSWNHDIAAFWVYPNDPNVYISTGVIGGTRPTRAHFSVSGTSGPAPFTVNFTDTSTTDPTVTIVSWHWDFGDGTTSNQQNPSHTYTEAGIFTVTLTVTDSNGDTNTSTKVITVGTSPPNTSCAHAIALDPSGGTMMIDNTWAPDTPMANDPANDPNGYDEGWQFQRQMWYKITNPTTERKFCRIIISGAIGEVLALLYYGPCNNLTLPWDYDEPPGHTIPTFEMDYAFAPSWGWFYQEIWGPLSWYSHSGAIDSMGAILEPGQTMYLELAGDDAYGPSDPGWKGTAELTWDLHDVTWYDVSDTRLPASSGGEGLSETMPPNTDLSTAGFDLTTAHDWLNQGLHAGQVGDPVAYIHHNNHHYIVAVGVKDLGDGYPDGTYRGAGWGQDQVGIWEIGEDGNQTNFWIIFTGIHTSGLSIINQQTGEGVDFKQRLFKFASDGTNLWLLAPLYQRVTNPYSTDPNHSTWAPTHAAVFGFNGSSWSQLGAVNAQTSNSVFFMNLVGGYSGVTLGMDCCASPAEPGVLHVIFSEWGVQDAPDGTVPNGTGGGSFGTSPRRIRWATSYGIFSPTAKLDQTTLFEADYQAGGDLGVGSHFAASEYFSIRNDGGSPVLFWFPETDDIVDHPVGLDHFDIYSLAGGSLSLIHTVTLDDIADFIATSPYNYYGGSWQPGWGPPVRFDGGRVSNEAVIDVGYDNHNVWYVLVQPRSDYVGSPPAYTIIFMRFEVDDPSSWTYFEGDTRKTTFMNIGISRAFDIYCEPKNTWIVADSNRLWQYVRCTNTYLSFPGWTDGYWGYQGSGPYSYNTYPSFRGPSNKSDFVGDFIYTATTFYYAPGDWGYGGYWSTPYTATTVVDGLEKTHILRNWLICNIDENVAPVGQASIFWFFKDGTWHNAGNDPDYNLYSYRGGQWHPHITDVDTWLYGRLQGQWQN